MSESNPEIKYCERSEIIKESKDTLCPQCKRRQNRPHCPKCGSTQTLAYSRTFFIKLDDGRIMKNCNRYRCRVCNLQFNDIDWFFHCFASMPEADMQATIELRRKAVREAHIQNWYERVMKGEKFTYNDKVQFHAQCGGSLDAYIDIVRNTEELRKAREKIAQLEKEKESEK